MFGLFFALYGAFGVYPFGQNTLSQYDLLAQIVPFAEHFFDVMQGDASLFYSYRVGGGMDVFGTVAYCLLSPFTVLFYIFGEGNVYYTSAIVLPAKLTCAAIAALVFLKRRFPSIGNGFALPCALLYAFCGYTFVANTYINWLDFLIWLPLALLGFNYMVKTGKIRYFALCIAACIYVCFSIACFSMLISYPVLVAYAFLVLKKGERKKYLLSLSAAYLCGVAAALPVMLPAAFAYLRSGRNTGVFDSLFNPVNADSYYSKFSYIFSDSLFFVLVAYYFIRTRLKSGESRFLAVAGLAIAMPVFVDEVCILMNMGSYYSYSLRFGFLNAVYELYIAGLVLQKARFFPALSKAEREREKSAKNAKYLVRPLIAQEPLLRENAENTPPMPETTRKIKGVPAALPRQIALGALLVLLALFSCGVIWEVWCVNRNLDGFDFSFWSALSAAISSAKEATGGNFASSFSHSLGGLEGIIIVFAVVALVTVFAIVLTEFRLVDTRVVYPVVALVLCAQIVYYGGILVAGNIFTPTYYREYNRLCGQILSEEDEYTRIKDNSATFTNVGGLITATNSYGVFSSVTDRDNFAVNEVFGYGGNKVNTMQSRYGTLFGDCLMGYKYYCHKTGGTSYLNYEYLTLLSETERLAMYENELVFPDCYTVPAGTLAIETDYNAYFDNMENLYSFLGGEGSVFSEYALNPSDVWEIAPTDQGGKAHRAFYVRCTLYESGALSFYSELPVDRGLKWYTGSYSSSSLRGMSEVKTYTYCNRGSSYHFCVVADDYDLTKEEILEKCRIKIVSVDTMRRLQSSLRAREQKYAIENSLFATTFSVRVEEAGAGENLFLNYMNIRGMTAYVNGKRTPLSENGLNLLIVPLEEGTNEVKIVYRSPYFAYILVGAGMGAAILFGVAWLLKKKKIAQKAETPVAILSIALAAGVVAFFMLFPTAVFILKLFGVIAV